MASPEIQRPSPAVPTVSVIIACFNCADFVERAIRSAASQDEVHTEIIAVDDASTDATLTRLTELEDDYPSLRVLSLPRNGGPSAARNHGISAATGDWIAVLDADDAFLPGRLTGLVAEAIESGADIVADNFLYVDFYTSRTYGPALRVGPAHEVIDLYAFVKGAVAVGSDSDYGLLKPVFRTEYVTRTHLRYNEQIRHAEDFDLIYTALLHGAKYVLIRGTSLYLYTMRSSGLSRTSVSYIAVTRQTRALQARARQSGDSHLVKLLAHRISSIDEYEMVSATRPTRSAYKLARAFMLAVTRGSARRWLLRKIVCTLYARAASLVGLPPSER